MSPRLAVLLAWLAAGVMRGGARGGARPRVLGGTDDVDHMFPFAVTLEFDHEQSLLYEPRLCSGALLTASWVLTAAHCLGSDIARIRYGDFEKLPNETNKFSKVLKSVPYPLYIRYMTNIVRNDIALLMVSAVPTRTFARLSAVDFLALTGQPAVLAGFSTFLDSNENDNDATRPLQVLEVMITVCEWAENDNAEKDDVTVSSNGPFLCVQSKCSEKGRSYITPGDSGGPLLHDGRLAGVAAIGVPLLSGGYTPVSPYLSWIHEVITATK